MALFNPIAISGKIGIVLKKIDAGSLEEAEFFGSVEDP